MDQTLPYWHLIFSKDEGRKLFPKVVDLFRDEGFPVLACREDGKVGKVVGIHYHLLVRTSWDEAKVRREVAKLRDKKDKDFSVRGPWFGTRYLCKGASPADPPEIVVNTIPDFGDAEIARLHEEWWRNVAFTEEDPDYKPPKPFDMLIEWTKDRTARSVQTTPGDAMNFLVDAYVQLGGQKACANKSNAQCYVRTAMLFSLDAKKYRSQTIQYFLNGLY